MSLADHLALGVTTVARAWEVTRADGLRLGFTDHDRPLAFDGLDFRPEAGLTARVVVQGTGLAVDNSAALGALSSDRISEADIEAGRYDGAGVRAWLVNWADPAERQLVFAGTLGEVTRGASGFEAELRGLTEALNRPGGRLYQRDCTATLGDTACGVDLSAPDLRVEVTVAAMSDTDLTVAGGESFAEGWFARGALRLSGGAGAGLSATVKADRPAPGGRRLTLWQPIRATVLPGDPAVLVAGCDKTAETCRAKFANFLNFRGFPDIPGEDWLAAIPARRGESDGGSRR